MKFKIKLAVIIMIVIVFSNNIFADQPVIRRGMRGEEVEQAQQLLWDIGYNIEVDGIFGQSTKDIVQALQKSFGLQADGIIGSKTWELLNKMTKTTTYEVQRGDTLYDIAKKYNIELEALKLLNGITGTLIHIGDKLKIPRSGVGGGERQDLITDSVYTVKRGDTLISIAKEYNTSVDTLKNYNNLNSSLIRIGQKIRIPHLTPESDIEQDFFTLKENSLIWPVSGTITSGYGWRINPISDRRQFHSGVDIAAAHGTAVRAVAAGVIVRSDWMGGYGKTVIIEHGQNVNTLYAHNSKLLLREGAYVVAEQIIAFVGSTGYSTGPHVHFELIVDNDTVNPLKFLR